MNERQKASEAAAKVPHAERDSIRADADQLEEMAGKVSSAIVADEQMCANLLRQVLDVEPEPVLRRWIYNRKMAPRLVARLSDPQDLVHFVTGLEKFVRACRDGQLKARSLIAVTSDSTQAMETPALPPSATTRHRRGYSIDERAIAMLVHETARKNWDCLRWSKTQWEVEVGCGKKGLATGRAPGFNTLHKEKLLEYRALKSTSGSEAVDVDNPGELDGGVQ